MGETLQSFSSEPPEEGNDTLAFVIECPDCNTQRSFRINNGWMMTATSKSAGMGIDTFCEKCRRQFSVKLAWTKRSPGWTVNKIEIPNAKAVADEIGLI